MPSATWVSHGRHTHGRNFRHARARVLPTPHSSPSRQRCLSQVNGTFLNQPDKYPAEAAVAEMMQQYWVNFAKTGNPNGKGLPYWPSFNPALPTTMQFSNGASLINVPNREQIDFVDRFFEWQRERTEGERGVKSTTCNPDGTVTFRYWNDNAKEVLVDVQFAGRHPMVKDSKTGAWTVTLGPAAPDMYPYCFIVDGVSMMDPKNPQYFPNEGFKNSLLEMKNPKAPLPHDIRDVEHGQIDYIHYYSASLGATNNAVVYLPPSYKKKPNKKYPVFYLISGEISRVLSHQRNNRHRGGIL